MCFPSSVHAPSRNYATDLSNPKPPQNNNSWMLDFWFLKVWSYFLVFIMAISGVKIKQMSNLLFYFIKWLRRCISQLRTAPPQMTLLSDNIDFLCLFLQIHVTVLNYSLYSKSCRHTLSFLLSLHVYPTGLWDRDRQIGQHFHVRARKL